MLIDVMFFSLSFRKKRKKSRQTVTSCTRSGQSPCRRTENPSSAYNPPIPDERRGRAAQGNLLLEKIGLLETVVLIEFLGLLGVEALLLPLGAPVGRDVGHRGKGEGFVINGQLIQIRRTVRIHDTEKRETGIVIAVNNL